VETETETRRSKTLIGRIPLAYKQTACRLCRTRPVTLTYAVVTGVAGQPDK